MSLPEFSCQQSLYSIEMLLGKQFAPDDRYRLFATAIYPLLAGARGTLAEGYCADNGRPGLEPVLLLGVSVLQFLDRVSDRAAAELLKYHLGWKLALGQDLDLDAFDPSTLVYFRQRLLENNQGKLAFDAVLEGLRKAGLVPARGKQRLDSTHVLGLLAHLGSLDRVRETLRLALVELNGSAEKRPAFWATLWERYVESKLDYRADEASLKAKFLQAGEDMTLLVAWASAEKPLGEGRQMKLLARVLEENFQTVEGKLEQRVQPAASVMNPHEPEATWCAKGSGDDKKAWVGYKAQVAETVPEQPLEKGEPTTALITSIVTQPATESDEVGMDRTLAEQQDSGLERPAELYVDAGYTSAQAIKEAGDEGRELVGPAQPPATRPLASRAMRST